MFCAQFFNPAPWPPPVFSSEEDAAASELADRINKELALRRSPARKPVGKFVQALWGVLFYTYPFRFTGTMVATFLGSLARSFHRSTFQRLSKSPEPKREFARERTRVQTKVAARIVVSERARGENGRELVPC
jgi:hypothetical protein